jgi:hypothetical protein
MINGLENKLVCDICKIEININYDKKKKNNPSNIDNKRTHYNNKMKELTGSSNFENDINFNLILQVLKQKGLRKEDVECHIVESILESFKMKNYIKAFAITYYIRYGEKLNLTKEQEKLCYDTFLKFIQFTKTISINKRSSTNYESALGNILKYNKITDLFSSSSNKNSTKRNKNALEWEKFVHHLENEEVSTNKINNIIEYNNEAYDEMDYDY